MSRSIFLLCYVIACAFNTGVHAQSSATERLAGDIRPLISILSGQNRAFGLQVEVQAPIDGRNQSISLRVKRCRNDDYELHAIHKDYSFIIQRSKDSIALVLPHHQVVFKGTGKVETESSLSPDGILGRLISSESTLYSKSKLLAIPDARALAAFLLSVVDANWDDEEAKWMFDDKIAAKFSDDGSCCRMTSDQLIDGDRVEVQYSVLPADIASFEYDTLTNEFQEIEIPREELERQLLRGVSRATEILFPGPRLTNQREVPRSVDHGQLLFVDGQRVCILAGTPEEIGAAHGQLLREEALKTIDSVLYTFGTVNTIRTGRWFRHDLEAAYRRLAPYIPKDHKIETAHLATALEIDEDLAQTINVFPELFHCSGFAVFGSATKDGKLYHGRVLDYMTTIGLQDAATNFIVSVDGKIPFVNVGYAGFIGSVTGMNAEAISLGEMGGRGEGQWDGVPMATLMRRALEECSTLDEVKKLWSASPRTCEYYYVFADGKTNDAVGVAATPETIEFVDPGQGHERLGEGIEDCVVLSAGSRLAKLRERVQQKHGQIDKDIAIWLMSRPVAMKSNLHNALFVPSDGILYVANADHKHPAAERPYVKIDLKALLESSKAQQSISLSK